MFTRALALLFFVKLFLKTNFYAPIFVIGPANYWFAGKIQLSRNTEIRTIVRE